MTTTFANIGGVADPRSANQADVIGTSHEAHDGQMPDPSTQRRGSLMYTDSSIMFEEYHYYAKKSREYEKTLPNIGGAGGLLNIFLGKKQQKVDVGISPSPSHDSKDGTTPASDHGINEKAPHVDPAASTVSSAHDQYGVTPDEYYNAQRAVRTATWGSVFYLITTDILGPYSVPWAISQMGYGPGTGLYVSFGVLACYSGAQLYQMFLGLDSTKYPLRNYGDLAFRLYGNWARVGVNVLQSFQFFMNVALLIVGNGQGLQQMAAGANGTGFICFVVAELVIMLVGFFLGQIRTLQRLSFLANLAVWLNVIVIIMTMVVTNKYEPNYDASFASYGTEPNQPVHTYTNWPPGLTLRNHINGLMQGVYSYGGATLFNELMAEMRRPHDFWKSLIFAEVFIIGVYITMGMVVYAAQGQYAFNPAYQGIPNSAYQWQTLGNAVSLISGLIAAVLYGNIGVKVLYSAVFRDIFHLPALDKKLGKWIWVGLVPVYWGAAFVIAAAVPQVSNLGAFVGAATILQFSYTFPPILRVAFNTKKDAIRPESEGFDPRTGEVIRLDSGFKRWMRGYLVQWHFNIFDTLYFLAALSVAGLGIYSSVISMHRNFEEGRLTPFTCGSPTG
ncbi:hypothetical protein LTR78_010195 [Recurvomyces mirabilis]|uniref:Amino acid transporter transmembrane domain-containing protein n=1 Tax=Recurvomyces mirabilis TaxID=574656 RepID=A0AAE0TMQ5_9PEZI|nr:hypothetical protein LTR78_010195 [Recurvomyces mirabilis]KAK5149724.1 hypothetical protein LTS14_010722 [Recurvomyces mirabilis]